MEIKNMKLEDRITASVHLDALLITTMDYVSKHFSNTNLTCLCSPDDLKTMLLTTATLFVATRDDDFIAQNLTELMYAVAQSHAGANLVKRGLIQNEEGDK